MIKIRGFLLIIDIEYQCTFAAEAKQTSLGRWKPRARML